MHRSRLTSFLLVAILLTASVSMTSCGGGGGGNNPDLVLLGFNVPNLAGIPLNQALIFTFSAPINPSTITPDSLRVVGTSGPFFEQTIVDGNLVALIPTVPNFADYSDAGLQPDIEYTVSLTEFPAVTTIESTSGKPLLQADTFTFRTLPAKTSSIVSNIRCNGPDGILGTADDTTPGSPSFFVEPRRGIRRGTGYVAGGRDDNDGCLQNSATGNSLYQSPLVLPSALQSGSGPGVGLLCLQNEGSPRVIESLCLPRHDQRAVGSPSAVAPGLIDLGGLEIRVNEPLDPLTVEPFFNGIPVNVQLFRVALKNGDFTGPDQIATTKPIVVQDTEESSILLTAAGPVQQGIYLINISPAVKDLPGCPLLTTLQDPLAPPSSQGGYNVYESEPDFQQLIGPGYRIYFHTLEVPDTPLAIVEDFGNNIAEHGDNASTDMEPGLYTDSDFLGGTDPLRDTTGGDPRPNITTSWDNLGDVAGTFVGQTTTAAWNSGGSGPTIADVQGYRFLNIPTLLPNANPVNPNPGTLQAVHQPWCGNGTDGPWLSQGDTGFNTDTSSVDGILEVESFHLQAGHTLTVTGSKPLLILCQGDFLVDGTIILNGGDGGHGFDTDGSARYTNAGAADVFGAAGLGGPGGGDGARGPNTVANVPEGNGFAGGQAATLFDAAGTDGGSRGTFFAESAGGVNDGSVGGAGGGFGEAGGEGTNDNLAMSIPQVSAGGVQWGDADFSRLLTAFEPDRGYHPMSSITGGTGGGSGSAEDDNGASEVGDNVAGPGDDAGGGGGGAGGGIWVIAKGTITVSATGAIEANGGAGGNTYGPNEQAFDPGEDGNEGTADDIFTGLAGGAPAMGTGEGGPGGGGSGGGIFLCGRTGLTIAAGAQLSAVGGAGGTSKSVNGGVGRAGGVGGAGRILCTTFEGSAAPSIAANTCTPDAPGEGGVGTPTRWSPTIDTTSVGQSEWVDLFTTSTQFAPDVNMIKQFPTFNGNFSGDLNEPGLLEVPVMDGGGGQVFGNPGVGTFNAQFEFQGADDLSSPTVDLGTPTVAVGLTQWYDVTSIEMINFKRYFRWRWRFFAQDGYGEDPGDPANLPLPTVFDLTIPFIK